CSSIAMTSAACWISIPACAPVSSGRRRSSCPTRTTSAVPPFSRYSSAPRTISSGAWSPPMASTAMRTGLCRGAFRLDLEDLAAAEHAAVRTCLVRGLGALALRTRHEILRLQRQMAAALALRWPFAGGLFAILTDFSDLFLMNAIGGIDDYQRLDKLCDLAYMLVFLKVALGWTGLERGVAVGLFAFRMIGEVVFELSGARWTLLVFPNVFEFWFIAVAALHHYRPGTSLSRRDAGVAFVLLLLGKEAQEYFLHFDRFLDNFTAFDAVTGIWRRLFGR